MKKRIILALCSLIIAGAGIGMSTIPHEELPVSEELLAEAMEIEEEPEEIIEEAEIKICEEGCTLEEGHEGECVLKKEDIQVILKSTSMERDLKVKFVSKANGKVISGADFKMKVTSPSNTTKEYSDHDNDGIIWVKDIDGGNYTVAMVDLEGYVTADVLKAEVKNKIEYKVVEIVDEVKTEKEVEVSKEDASYGGTDKDESTSNSTVLTDTVEYVASSVKEEVKTTSTQKKDENGQLVYEKQKLDALNQPMYQKILKESANFHVDSDGDKHCDRCGASMCTAHADKNNDQKCDSCGDTVDAGLHQHTDAEPKDCKCDDCDANLHTVSDCVCSACGQTFHETSNGICKNCDKLINESEHTSCTDSNGVCKYCQKATTVSCSHEQKDAATGNCTSCGTHVLCVDGEDEGTTCDSCQKETVSQTEDTASRCTLKFYGMKAFGVNLRSFSLLSTANEPATAAEVPASEQFITYDTSSPKVYDTTSAPVYETETVKTYYGWQTIDGATYYFDKNGNKVTGSQVIQGVSYTFSSEGVRSGTIGIDVSKYQTNINWTKIKNAGINFVMIRCGYRGYGSGVLVEDSMYASHIKGAKAAGLRVGVYFFSQAINEAEAVEEASMAVALANKYGINMPIAIDSEYANGGKGRADGLSKSARTAVTKAFCNTVKNAGHTPMVYASKSWFSNHLDVSQLSGYRIWVAHYADKCGYTGTYHMWQHTDKGKVDGYSGYLDMNISSI